MTRADQGRQAYRVEAAELLDELEQGLLELEDNPDDHELINRIFRAMHTIKGSGSMFGFEEIASFTHEVETVMDQVRSGTVSLFPGLIDLLFKSRDLISDMLADRGADRDKRAQDIIKSLKGSLPAQKIAKEAEQVNQNEAEHLADKAEPSTFRIRFRPHRNIFFTGAKPLALLDELFDLGICEVKAGTTRDTPLCKIIARTDDIPDLAEMNPEMCYTWWDIILTTSDDENAIRDIFIFVEDDCDLHIEKISSAGAVDIEEAHDKLGEILVQRGVITEQDVEEVLSLQKRIGSILVQSGKVSAQEVASALAEQEVVKKSGARKKDSVEVSSIRVDSSKLDSLVDLVGELVIAQARLNQIAGEIPSPSLQTLAEEMERLSDSLRDSTLGIRMMPIGTTFSKFIRLVRDLSRDLKKDIRLITKGAETELDKTVIERLNDPLVHLLRNSIDHGIEPPKIRESQGKPAQGTITLSAAHAGGEVVIEIVDDGQGLDPDAIRKKALEKGLISSEAELGDFEVQQLIFEPGFSTAGKITGVSGRGVGMDVVKRSIESLRGNVFLESVKGSGTRITVKLPLTLAIIDGLQIRIGDDNLVVPLAMVEECVELRMDGKKKESKSVINLRGEMVPYIRLSDWFSIPCQDLDIEQIVIVSVKDQRVGLVVDKVVGQHQTVIKSLGQVYRNVRGISGATVRGDGSMALILDVPALVADVEAEQPKGGHQHEL
ncbi:chemotaxis protein CheA [Desulfonatronovibrio hydrogenovorans]|uniref:chemotaxis protein CheA n=1 Tax=Desulfonatronovibrio hydrogenovorans TaxID=53245 RepID=UPI00048CF686|nr:chemotaxis protein CheA [Desulfonatronovibrio hydrogenovorans]